MKKYVGFQENAQRSMHTFYYLILAGVVSLWLYEKIQPEPAPIIWKDHLPQKT